MVHRRQPGNWECSLMESPMTRPVAHPIRCWYDSVVTQRRVDYFVSTIKVCKTHLLDSYFQQIFSTYSVFDSLHVFTAYRLQFCLPPPIIPNAEILMASKEFKIGRWETLSQTDISTHTDVHKYCYQGTTSVLHIGHILTCGIVAHTLLNNLTVSLHCRRFTG